MLRLPAKLRPERLKAGYDGAYRDFYRWRNIGRAALGHSGSKHQVKHLAYAAGWKKFEPLWDVVIKTRRLGLMTPVLEGVLSKVSRKNDLDRLEPSATPATTR